jgi:hypothetical protein
MNKRVLVLTGYTDSIEPPYGIDDQLMKPVFDLTLKSKIEYAKINNYDIMALRSFGKDSAGIFNENKIGQLRFIRSFELLNIYDAVMWIDADSLITNYSYKLEDFIDDSTTFVASYDWAGPHSFSTGNFIIQKTPNLNKLIELFYLYGPRFNSEQEVLNMINYYSLHNGIKSLDYKFLGSTPTKLQYGKGWETRPEPKGPWTKDCFLVHLTGVSNTRRIEILNTYFKEFL